MCNRRPYFLYFVPGLIVATGLAFISQMYPIALNGGGFFGQDPAYQYLFAGVDILQGNAPAHTDHPGTPVQSLIALMILLVWGTRVLFGLTAQDVFDSVLASPELYMVSVSIVLLLLGAVAAYFLGRRVWQTTGSPFAGVSCQVTALLFSLVAPYIVYPTPEAALLCISVALMAVLTPALLGVGGAVPGIASRDAIFAGALCGIGVAVKITFVPLVGLLISLWSLRLWWRALAALVIAWFIGVLPIWPRLAVMFAWFKRVLTHSGLHGRGDEAILNLQQFWQSVVSVMNMFPLLYDVALVMTVVVCIGLARKAFAVVRGSSTSVPGGGVSDRSVPLLREFVAPASLMLVLAAQTVMVAKHPGPTYMIAVLPVSVMGGAWVLFAQRMVPLPATIRPWLAAGWLILLVYTCVNVSFAGYAGIRAIHETGVRSRETVLAPTASSTNPILIGTFNCNLPECALWFGLLMVPEMELRLDRITPNFYHFDIFGKRLHLPGKGELTPEATADTVNGLVQTGRPVFLVSPPYEQLAQFRLEKVTGDSIQNLYRVNGYERPN